MSTEHGGPVTLKPISEIAQYLKGQLPANIPQKYALKSRLESIASEENIRNGVAAFRDFLYAFFDRIILDGDAQIKLPKTPKNMTDYPFLYGIADLLTDMGYHGILAENGSSLWIAEMPLFIPSTEQGAKKPKNSVAKLFEGLRFLALCGFVFTGIDLNAKALPASGVQIEVTYPSAPLLLAGLKALAVADVELRVKRYVSDDNHDNILRCDYRLLQAEAMDVLDALKDFVRPLPEEVQRFALALHQRYTGKGLTCAALLSTFEAHFAYSFMKNSKQDLSPRDVYEKRTWEFAYNMRHGYCLVVRSKKTDQYADVIEKFPLPLQQKIARGYGCDRKLHNEPCQGGCQGIRLPLDGLTAGMAGNIEAWLDHEVLK